MAATFLDLFYAKVVILQGLLDPAGAAAGLRAVDAGQASDLLDLLARTRGLTPEQRARIERVARRCLFLKGESVYLKLLRERGAVPEDRLRGVMWAVRDHASGRDVRMGELLAREGVLAAALDQELDAAAQAALERDNAGVTEKYRAAAYAGIERNSQTVADVLQALEQAGWPTAGPPPAPAPPPAPLPADETEGTRELAGGAPAFPPELARTGLDEKYVVLRKLGEGGMGAVYLAYEKDDAARERPMALKVVLDMAKSSDAAARFKREILATSMCAHENIIEIHDAAETADGSFYMAMECIDGEQLDEALKREGPLDLRRVVDLTEQALQGLEAIHQSNIVHRDIKPQNFRIWRDKAGRERLKIMDFGIARVLDAEDSGAGDQFYTTMAGKITGSPAYIAPESITEPTVDGRADLYSLGVTIYRIATGRLPFVAKEASEFLPMHLYQKPPLLREGRPDAPEPLERLVAWLLEKLPSRRPQTATEALALLRAEVRPVFDGGAPATPAAPQAVEAGGGFEATSAGQDAPIVVPGAADYGAAEVTAPHPPPVGDLAAPPPPAPLEAPPPPPPLFPEPAPGQVETVDETPLPGAHPAGGKGALIAVVAVFVVLLVVGGAAIAWFATRT